MKIDSGTLTQVTDQDINPDGTFVIPSAVRRIGGYAFYGCGALTTLTIPNGVTTIDDAAFANCSELTTLTIPDSVITIADYAFVNCRGLSMLTIPDSVVTIGRNAFSGCRGLTTLTISDSVLTIANNAFSDCIGLTTLTIPDSITTIGRSAFSDCIGLITLTIPDSVTTIDRSAFFSCSGLSTLMIPDSVTTIGDFAFSECKGLSTLTISDSVRVIGDDAFDGCNALGHIYVSQAQEGGVEKIQDLLPAHLRDKVVAVSPAGRLTKSARPLDKLGLFDAPEPALPLATLLQESKKQISAPGQVQLIFKTHADAQAMQSALEQTGMQAGASAAAQYAIEDISKTDEINPAASAASAAATDSPSGYAIKISKAEYNQLMGDDLAYDCLSQSANDRQLPQA